MRPPKQMNQHERRAWRVLLELGARVEKLPTGPTLDIRPIRITSERKLRIFASALIDVAGRSGANRRHMDRAGCLVFVVTDDPDYPRKP